MSRASLQTLTTALLISCVCATTFACSSDTPSADARPIATERAAATPSTDAAPTQAAAVETTPEAVAEAIAVPESEAPVLASAAPTLPLERKAQPEGSLRSPSLLPDGTPEANVAAFTNLPLAKSDKAPVGGVGSSGIHLDVLEVGKGWAASRCEELGSEFDVETDSRVNVCFRVVHPRVDESVTVEWARDGKVRTSIDVSVKPTHAYRTRAWLPVSAAKVGDWTATIKSEDGSVLGQVGFRIAD